MEAVVTPKRVMTVDMEATYTSATETTSPPETIAEARLLEMTGVAMEMETPGAAEVGSSSAGVRGKMIFMEDDGSGSNIDPEEVQTFEERFTREEVRTEGST